MRIVGFAQTMRLGRTAEEGHELKIELDNGMEVSVPTSVDTIMALTKLWADSRVPGKVAARVQQPAPAPEPEMPPPPVDVEEEDEGEVFGGDIPRGQPVVADDMGYPVPQASSMPRPRFLDTDDEDGNQV